MPGFAWIKNDGISYITLPHWAEQGVNVAFSPLGWSQSGSL